MDWRPMTEHKFPWEHVKLVVAVYDKNNPGEKDLLRVLVAEHGAMFPESGGMLSIHENGWVPYAWKLDDTPEPDSKLWPPLLHDYLTEPETTR